MNGQPWIAVLTLDPVFAADIRAEIAATGADTEIAADVPALHQAIERWPTLILIDLAVTGWEAPVRRAKTLPHTRAIPIVAFGDRMSAETLTTAQQAGCDHAWDRSRLFAELPALLRSVLHPPTRWVAGWNAPPPAALCRAAEQFNAGEYWECHETLEALWVAEPRPIRDLYQGVLQIGVAFHHLQQGNYAGAIKMFRRGLPRLRGLPETCQGVRVGQLAAAARAVHDAAAKLGAARIGEIDLAALPKITIMGCPLSAVAPFVV